MKDDSDRWYRDNINVSISRSLTKDNIPNEWHDTRRILLRKYLIRMLCFRHSLLFCSVFFLLFLSRLFCRLAVRHILLDACTYSLFVHLRESQTIIVESNLKHLNWYRWVRKTFGFISKCVLRSTLERELFMKNYIVFMVIKRSVLEQLKDGANDSVEVNKNLKTNHDLVDLLLKQHLRISNKFGWLLMMILVLR